MNTGAVEVTVNGRIARLAVSANTTLAQLLRDHLGLMGTKVACDRGECGACTVLVDSLPTLSCTLLALTIPGSSITTVEGLADGIGQLTALQQAFLELDAVQCGFCTPGFLVTATHLLRTCPSPDRDAVVAALNGNLCRCGCYNQIVAAVLRASEAGVSAP